VERAMAKGQGVLCKDKGKDGSMKRDVQTRTQALIEQVVSQVVIFTCAVITSQLFVYRMFDITVTLDQNIGMMVYWTGQSVFIRYFLRRFFEKRL
jgi:hypothetical protein